MGQDMRLRCVHKTYKPSGLAHFRFSTFPVFGHRISCQETGSIVAPIEQISSGIMPKNHREIHTRFASGENYSQVIACGGDIVGASIAQRYLGTLG